MLRNEKGNAMMLSILILATIFVLTIGFIFISDANTKHAHREETKTQAYYVAKTGADSMIKHLYDDYEVTKDMRDKIVELRDSVNPITGSYKSEDFEIEVKEEKRPPIVGETVYLVKSKSKVKKGEDSVTAVLIPKYRVDKTWGSGTVDAGNEVYLAGLGNLKGAGIKINLEAKKYKNIPSPIFIQDGLGGEEIQDLFIAEPARKKKIAGYELIDRKDGDTDKWIKSEKLVNKTLKDFETLEFNYDMKRATPEVTYPSRSNSEKKEFNSGVIDADKVNVGKVVKEKYSTVEFDENEQIELKVKEKEALKIESDVFEVNGDITIQTSEKRDIIIVTKVLNIIANSKVNVEGNGNVYFYIEDSGHIYGNSEMGYDLYNPKQINGRTNIHFYLKPGKKLALEVGAKVKNSFVYGPGKGTRMELKGGSVYSGRMLVDTVDFNGECTIQSPVDGTPNEEKDPIIGFKAIEWEK